MTDRVLVPASVGDYRRLAERRLPRSVFGYIDGAANDETTMAENSADLRRVRLRQRVLRDVSQVSTRTQVLGQEWSMPLALGPVGFAGTFARRGEVQAARAAEAAGIPFALSTVGVCPIEEVRAGTKAQFWFQLYMLKDRGISQALLQRAAAAGCPVLVLTVDTPLPGLRHRDTRTALVATPTLGVKVRKLWDFASHTRWLFDVPLGGGPLGFGCLTEFMPKGLDYDQSRVWVGSRFDSSLNWRDVEWLRQQWRGKLVIKGILDPEDAALAAQAGVDGIIVSNHGGRQLDGVPSTISALPGIVDAVGGRLEVLMDSGVRSGLDIVKALALGAKACLVGRAWAWALGARGQRGVSEVLGIFRKELEVALALNGVTDVTKLNRTSLAEEPQLSAAPPSPRVRA